MKNITSTWRHVAQLARRRGESMVSVHVEAIEGLVWRLQALDRVLIAAEDYMCAVDDERVGANGDELAAAEERLVSALAVATS